MQYELISVRIINVNILNTIFYPCSYQKQKQKKLTQHSFLYGNWQPTKDTYIQKRKSWKVFFLNEWMSTPRFLRFLLPVPSFFLTHSFLLQPCCFYFCIYHVRPLLLFSWLLSFSYYLFLLPSLDPYLIHLGLLNVLCVFIFQSFLWGSFGETVFANIQNNKTPCTMCVKCGQMYEPKENDSTLNKAKWGQPWTYSRRTNWQHWKKTTISSLYSP